MTLDLFQNRHLGPDTTSTEDMLKTIGFDGLEHLVSKTIPEEIRCADFKNTIDETSEHAALCALNSLMQENVLPIGGFIGRGYYGTLLPAVIQRNVLENPGWYTQYTPYQAEISQGRLEALLNFQTMVTDLTGFEIANASLLDEATAAAEAMTFIKRINRKNKGRVFLVADTVWPQTVSVMRTRGAPLGIEVRVCDMSTWPTQEDVFGAFIQQPNSFGDIKDQSVCIAALKSKGIMTAMSCDLLALTLFKSPAEMGAVAAVGTTQRFGVPMGYGGPHAAYFATDAVHSRQVPGRLVGVSEDIHGQSALRLALQTREQHIRRDKATSNICTAQALPAILASMYAIYHGFDHLRDTALRLYQYAEGVANTLKAHGFACLNTTHFDAISFRLSAEQRQVLEPRLKQAGFHIFFGADYASIAIDETHSPEVIQALLSALTQNEVTFQAPLVSPSQDLCRSKHDVMTHPNFNEYRSETSFLRYVHRLQGRDLSLTHSMIPLGSCTMKLNATSEMQPLTWPEISNLHPYAPKETTIGIHKMLAELETWLAELAGFDGTSLQPNSGAQGELAGLLAIAGYHRDRGDLERNICLIPASAHGTNPASAVMAGLKVVVVKCTAQGEIDLDDLRLKIDSYASQLAAIMITYPSTYGVFDADVKKVCDMVHAAGGLVYLDGANMNAQVGLARPGDYGADVCHLNLHKTFCIPHGGGGPGMGPICAKSHLLPYLPSDPASDISTNSVAASHFSSASILTITWMYIRMMGTGGLRKASELAILNANYMAKRLETHYPILYRGPEGTVAHEFILSCREIKSATGVTVEDIAKRLIDYGFHAPTMSWPVLDALMVEPTESEDQKEMDRFCDAMIHIRGEIQKIENGEWPKDNNPLKNAPHTVRTLTSDAWPHPYSREEAVFPVKALYANKFWPFVGRVNNAHGDRNLVCTCPPLEAYEG